MKITAQQPAYDSIKWGDFGPFLSHVTKQQFVDIHCTLKNPFPVSTFDITLSPLVLTSFMDDPLLHLLLF